MYDMPETVNITIRVPPDRECARWLLGLLGNVHPPAQEIGTFLGVQAWLENVATTQPEARPDLEVVGGTD